MSWERARPPEFDLRDLSKELPAQRHVRRAAGAASKAKNYADWTKAFVAWLSSTQTLDIFKSPSARLVSKPGESEGDFRVRLQQAARERRDARSRGCGRRYAPKVASLQERLRRAQQAVAEGAGAVVRVEDAGGDLDSARRCSARSSGGRRSAPRTSAGSTTAARGMGRVVQESQDVARAQENMAASRRSSGARKPAGRDRRHRRDVHPQTEPLETIALKPKRAGIQIKLVALVWVACMIGCRQPLVT